MPGAGLTMVDTLLMMPDDGWRYEVVEEDVIPGFRAPLARLLRRP